LDIIYTSYDFIEETDVDVEGTGIRHPSMEMNYTSHDFIGGYPFSAEAGESYTSY
jgi:hypothetical protein